MPSGLPVLLAPLKGSSKLMLLRASYWVRFAGSLRVSYACKIFWKWSFDSAVVFLVLQEKREGKKQLMAGSREWEEGIHLRIGDNYINVRIGMVIESLFTECTFDFGCSRIFRDAQERIKIHIIL